MKIIYSVLLAIFLFSMAMIDTHNDNFVDGYYCVEYQCVWLGGDK